MTETMATSVGIVHYTTTSPHKILQQANTNNEQTRREIIILRKPPSAAKKKAKEAPKTTPVAVARRNARERNRVKQVNNGFANLRQHIPAFIAAAFETSTRGGANKKLSKVETLRMAVEYIRSLEDLLEDGGALEPNNASMASLSPNSSTTHSRQFQMLSPVTDDDDDDTTPPQYYHLYDDSENLEPLNVDAHILADPALMDAAVEFRGAQDLSILQGDSLSPGMYSEGSEEAASEFGGFEGVVVKSEEVIPVISLKEEHELGEQKHSLVNVMQWWEQHQQQQKEAL